MNIYKKLRKEKKITQVELAEMLNVNQATVSKWESGETVPDYTTLLKLSKIYGVTTDCLLGNEQSVVENILPKENTITVFGYGGERKDYQLTPEQAKMLEQLAQEMSKNKS